MKRTDSKIISRLKKAAASIFSKYDNLKKAGLKETPDRFVKAWEEMLSGYNTDPASLIKIFPDKVDQMICIKDIDFTSMCMHHGISFFGKVHIAYIPRDGIVGISKFGRIVDAITKRLQTQEAIAKEIADVIETKVKPLGVMVIVHASHLCMTIRGVKKQNANMINSEIRGIFRTDSTARLEALHLLRWTL